MLFLVLDVSNALTLVDVIRTLTGMKTEELFRPRFKHDGKRLNGLKNEPCYLQCEVDYIGKIAVDRKDKDSETVQ